MDCRPSRTQDPDEWIATCPPLSKPICEELREWIFRWEPDLKESINSNMLCYSRRKRVVSLGAFNDHAEICFYRGGELPDPAKLFNHGEGNMGIRGIKVTSLDDLGKSALRALVHAAVTLDMQPALPPPPKVKREPWPMPPLLEEGLKKNKKAGAFFESLKPTYQREYMVWVSTAKREETQQARLKETLAALAAGKKWAQRKEG
jgi:uncharacterized protein YdeI (YjbR/CyaY-like superfamily)